MSLLVIGYHSRVTIKAEPKNYDLDKGQRTAHYRLTDISTEVSSANAGEGDVSQKARTDLTVRVNLADKLTLLQNSVRCGDTAVSNDKNNPTKITYTPVGSDEECTVRVYCVQMEKEFELHILNALVGESVPDFTFDASIGFPGQLDDAQNNETFLASAKISGTADNRAYDVTLGNLSQVSVGVTRLTATGVYKMADKRLMELDGEITYTIVYNNVGKTPIENLYLYDILPYENDGRGSQFDGSWKAAKITADLQQGTGGAESRADLFYSEEDASGLDEKLSGWEDGEARFEEVFGTSESSESFLGKTENGRLALTSDELEKKEITALGVYIDRLEPQKKFELTITLKTEGNTAGNVYGNNASTWIDTGTAGGESALVTNTVQTSVVSRSISGKVWYDADWSGSQDNGERMLAGIEVYLFKKDEGGTYQECKTNMEGETVSPCKTDKSGTYLFNSLEAGDYLVAFAGETLSEYLGTAPYQKHGIAKEKNSDGTELTGTEGLDKKFLYRISCTAEEPDITLKTVGDIADGGSFTDNVSDMDLGLVKGASLRVKKRVETADGEVPELSNEPIDPAYRFLIRVTDVTDQAGKYEYAAFSLPHDGTSPDIELEDFSDGGIRKFEIRETAPMEYSLVKAAAERTDESGERTITKLKAGEVLTVRPGDDITVTLSNEPRHSGYFHHTSALTNEKKAGESGFEKDKNADYKENHGNEGSQPKRNTRVNFAAAAEDRGRPKSQRGKEGGDEQDD